MYHLRLKIFIFLCIGGLIVTIGRLVTLQTVGVEQAREDISNMRILPAEQRPTIRGKILDRRERPLALDEPAFYLQVEYNLTRYRDRRWQEGRILRAIRQDKPRSVVEAELAETWKASFQQLDQVINLASTMAGTSREEIIEQIDEINDRLWEMARRIWWRRRNRDSSWEQYFTVRDSIGPGQVITVDLYEMHKSYPLVELKTEQDLLQAQRALIRLTGLKIEPQAKRSYPYGTAASQLIGWVGPVNETDMNLFENDDYMRYLSGEMLGKFGIERIYEPVLRGRRGEVTYDREGNLLEKKEPIYGRNVQVTIDIELQQRIEALLADKSMPHHGKISAAVVLDAARNDILAMASIPTFDLNRIRQYDYYNEVFHDPNSPMIHRALEKNYPPGSTAKPLILAAGLQERKITPQEIIHCTWELPPSSWPRCLIQRRGGSHDNRWEHEGGNTARNALRGSCNIYFSRLADRLNSNDLQKWFFYFGCGQNILPAPMPDDIPETAPRLSFKQSCGSIIYGLQTRPYTDVSEIEPFPPTRMSEKRYWGIGQGNLRMTVLQVANSLSVLARNGVYKSPRLIFDQQDPLNDRHRRQIPLSSGTLATVREGMRAVVNESGGSAYNEFRGSDLLKRNMTIYGKTGSTESPENAWFECLAEDTTGRSVVIVTLVEGGQSGSGEAVPLGKEILQFCNEAGYIGTKPIAEPSE
jgi:penicillin-binding protein 2